MKEIPQDEFTQTKQLEGEYKQEKVQDQPISIGVKEQEKEKVEAEKSPDAQEENATAKEASQNLQSALINIANGVVNVTTAGEKKEDDSDDSEKSNKRKNDKAEKEKKLYAILSPGKYKKTQYIKKTQFIKKRNTQIPKSRVWLISRYVISA